MSNPEKLMFYQFLNSFRTIAATDWDIIIGYAQMREFRAREVLLKEGSIARELFFVVGGILKIVSTNEKGNEVIQFFIKENRFCTILYSFNGGTVSREGIIAATDGKGWVFSRSALKELYARLPWFRELIEDITHRALLEKIRIRNSLIGEEATIRYQKFMADHPDILQRVSLSDVASYLGITQQSLSRIRRNTV
jgi:CRP-like cAMP-binding protein